jgi:transcriptional regulator with XRE-family HTH domain
MLRTNLPRAMRALRQRRGWRQHDLGVRAALSRDVVSRIERGQLAAVTVDSITKLAAALEATIAIELRWQGASLDQLVDAQHAALQETVTSMLAGAGWMTRVEVSFNHYGDRGSCDILAFHPAEGMLLVVEVKSQIGNVQDTLHRLDTKLRLGAVLAASAGWERPRSIAGALVIADTRTARRTVGAHASLFAAYGLRGWAAKRWLRQPSTAARLLWFQVPSDSDRSRSMSRGRVRPGRGAG